MKKDFLERSKTIKLLWKLLYISCALTLIPELFIKREGHFGIDGFFGFYAVTGFLSCVVLILIAKLGGIFLKKDPNYYDDYNQEIKNQE